MRIGGKHWRIKGFYIYDQFLWDSHSGITLSQGQGYKYLLNDPGKSNLDFNFIQGFTYFWFTFTMIFVTFRPSLFQGRFPVDSIFYDWPRHWFLFFLLYNVNKIKKNFRTNPCCNIPFKFFKLLLSLWVFFLPMAVIDVDSKFPNTLYFQLCNNRVGTSITVEL